MSQSLSPGSSHDDAEPPKKRGCPSWENSISRGQACLSCRQRKVKCNGDKPVCSGCTKLRRQHGLADSQAEQRFPCEYEQWEPGMKKKRVSRKMVQTLEDKVAALEAEIARLPPPPATIPSFIPPPPQPPLAVGAFPQTASEHDPSSSSSDGSPQASSHSPSSTYSAATSFTPDKSPGYMSQPALVPTAYSAYLPSPHALKRIVSLYLNSGHPCTSLFSHKTFFHRLARPPGTVEYPHDALLHAMVALAVELHGESILEGQKIPQSGPVKTDPAHWHAARARDLAHQGAITCDRFFDTLQAVILMSHYAHRICRFQDIWQLTGLGARVAVALRLNKLAPFSRNYKYEYCAYTNAPIQIVRIPRDVSDVTDRRMAFWWTFAAERFATANTGWAMVIQDEDITTMLPSASPARADEDDDWKSTSLTSPDFFLSHPAHLVGGVQLFFKATVLLGRGSIINQRFPRFAGGVKVSQTPDQVHRSDEFQLLERQISDYLISTSGFPSDHPTDIYSPFVACLPYVARILAHEPLCTASQGDRSMMLCMDAARKIEATVGQAGRSSTATELLPFLTFCWTVAGRTLIRQLAIKQAWEDLQGVPELKGLIDRLLGQIESFRSSNARNAYQVLSNFVSNPSILLPRMNLALLAPPPPPPAHHSAPPPTHHPAPSLHEPAPHQQQSPYHIPAEPQHLHGMMPMGVAVPPPMQAPPPPPPMSVASPAMSQGRSVHPPRPFYASPNFPLPDNSPSAFAFQQQRQAQAELSGLGGQPRPQVQTQPQPQPPSIEAQTAYRQQHLQYQRQRQQLQQQQPLPQMFSEHPHYPPPPDMSQGYTYMQATPQSIALLQAEQESLRRWEPQYAPH